MPWLENSTPHKVNHLLNLFVLLFFLPFLLYAVYQALSLYTRASGTRASIVIDTKTEHRSDLHLSRIQEVLAYHGKPTTIINQLLDEMTGTSLQVWGEGSWVTGFSRLKGKTIRLLLVNYDPKAIHTEYVPIQFIQLDPGAYTYRERLLFGRNITTRILVSIDNPSISRSVYLPAQSIAVVEMTKQ